MILSFIPDSQVGTVGAAALGTAQQITDVVADLSGFKNLTGLEHPTYIISCVVP